MLRRSTRTHTFPHPPRPRCMPPSPRVEFLRTCDTPWYTCNLHPGNHPDRKTTALALAKRAGKCIRRSNREIRAACQRTRQLQVARRITSVPPLTVTVDLVDIHRNYDGFVGIRLRRRQRCLPCTSGPLSPASSYGSRGALLSEQSPARPE